MTFDGCFALYFSSIYLYLYSCDPNLIPLQDSWIYLESRTNRLNWLVLFPFMLRLNPEDRVLVT